MWIDIGGGKQVEVRRLMCEIAVMRTGYSAYKLGQICDEYCKAHNIDVSFNTKSIGQFIRCESDFSLRRLEVFCDIIGWSKDVREISEKYQMPDPESRGLGLEIVGERGTTIRDFDSNKKITFRNAITNKRFI